MEYNIVKKEIKIDRRINELDQFVIDFVSLLDKYVIVSGYVSILTGRSRATEDVDLLIPQINKEEFRRTWKKILEHGFECLNTSKIDEAYEYLKEYAIRFCRIGKPIPNMEFKIIKNDIDRYSFDNRIKVILKNGFLCISPLEMQIAFKLHLGSDKDLEDAKHLFVLFKDKINKEELLDLTIKLNVKDKLRLIE